MKKVIYSLYIDIPDGQFYMHDKPGVEKKNTKQAFKENYSRLKESHMRYAKAIGVDYILFEYDKKYEEYLTFFTTNYPEINIYSVVNFYKLHLMYDLAEKYDEILYLDFDVIPLTNENFFDVWDLSKGMAIYNNNIHVNARNQPLHKLNHTDRSPTAKYYNAQAMLIETGHSPNNDVINTGIIGAKKEHIQQLRYFENFRGTLDLMTLLRTKLDGLYPPNIVQMFAYDNETVFSYKLQTTKTPHQWLDRQWHYFFDKVYYVPKVTKFCHCINKEFEMAWDRYEKNNL